MTTHDAIDQRNKDALDSLQDTLVMRKVPFAVFFTFETDEVLNWYDMLTKEEPRILNDLVISINPQSSKKSMVGELNMDVFYGV